MDMNSSTVSNTSSSTTTHYFPSTLTVTVDFFPTRETPLHWTTVTALAYPLTSVWTPPCDTRVWFTDFAFTGSENSCAPPSYLGAVFYGGYYSPGICPYGYTIACSAGDARYTASQRRTLVGQEPKDDETDGICVPIGWECNPTETKFAVSYLGTMSVSAAPAFDIRWREEDLPFLETHPLSPTMTTTPSDTYTRLTSTPRTFGSSGETKGSNATLSPGAIAGITVGVIAFVVICVCLPCCVFVLKRRKQRRLKDEKVLRPGRATAESVSVRPYVEPKPETEPEAETEAIGYADAPWPPVPRTTRGKG